MEVESVWSLGGMGMLSCMRVGIELSVFVLVLVVMVVIVWMWVVLMV